jgi:hypothetical protein
MQGAGVASAEGAFGDATEDNNFDVAAFLASICIESKLNNITVEGVFNPARLYELRKPTN